LKWHPEIIKNGLKIMCMRMEHLVFLYCLLYLVFLAQVPRSIRSDSLQILVPHYFNTEENLDYVGSIPDFTYYGASEMS
jgi:hypothetical protein